MEQQGESEHIKSKNKIRSSIRDCFPSRDCYTLVRPLNEEDKLQRVYRLSENELREEFRQQMESLKKLIFGRLKPKELNGKLLNGRSMSKERNVERVEGREKKKRAK